MSQETSNARLLGMDPGVRGESGNRIRKRVGRSQETGGSKSGNRLSRVKKYGGESGNGPGNSRNSVLESCERFGLESSE